MNLHTKFDFFRRAISDGNIVRAADVLGDSPVGQGEYMTNFVCAILVDLQRQINELKSQDDQTI